MAITQNRELISHNETMQVSERFILVIGNENAGKTSLINQMLQTDKGSSRPASSTYLLEYKYGRQAGITSLMENICHFWELGSGASFVSVLPAIVKSQQPTSVVLVLDLTLSGLIVSTTELLLRTLRSLLTDPLENEEDEIHWRPFPIPLVIIGGKYDLFQNFEPVKKRNTCQYLRCLAHILQADLFFYSKNDKKLVKNVREALLQYAFGISVNKNNTITDCDKPLYIPAVQESAISNIDGGSPVTPIDYSSLSKYRNNLLVHVNQQESNHVSPSMLEDPAKDKNFIERVIDNMCMQKEEELRRIQEENRRKAAAVESIRVTKIM